jgi:hypothetical protein
MNERLDIPGSPSDILENREYPYSFRKSESFRKFRRTANILLLQEFIVLQKISENREYLTPSGNYSHIPFHQSSSL